MVAFALLAFAPSPLKKIETKNVSAQIPAKTASKPVQAPQPEIPPVVQVEPETPVVAPPAVVEEAPAPAPVATNYPTDHIEIMQQAGIDPGDYAAVDYIISHESGWRHWVVNSEGSGATGLCQALPGSKMASAGADWATNPVTQMRWCTSYATQRYGGWQNAQSFWISHLWW